MQPLPHTVAGKVDRGAGYAARAKSMLALAARLKQLSHRYDLAVIVTNQVTSSSSKYQSLTRNRLVRSTVYGQVTDSALWRL